MLRSRLQLLFFSLSCLLSLCSTQQLVLTFTRSENLIALLCEDSFTGAAVPDPAFFRDGSFIELPSPVPAANGNGSILFTVNREIEGIYECGREASAGPQQRSLSEQRVVTLPFGAVTIPINPTLEFTYNTGTVARLDCPITPGSLRSQYYVIWRSAANQNMIFYRTFPPNDGSADLSFSNRYTVDDQNFSLYISGVTPGDMRFRYQCELGVEDPQHPTTQGITYGLAATLELSLSIRKLPEFITLPRNQLVTRGEDVSFSCSVLSSPDPASIEWFLGGRLVDHLLDPRYNESTTHAPNSNQEEGGVVTEGSLTIHGVDGFDSDVVQCRVTYVTSDQGAVRSGESATLSVLDVVEFSMSTLQIGGFILRARLRRPLQDPVALRLIYTDARNTSRSSAPVNGSIQYFAVDAINEVVSVDSIPFGTFMLSVAMVNHRIAGPFNSSSEVLHRRPPPTGVEVSLIVTGSLLGFIILLILCLLVVISVRYRGLSPTAKNVVKGNSKIVQQILGGCFSCNCNCCSRTRADSGERSKNGFNEKSAKSYVSTLKASIKLAESDEVIKQYWSSTALLRSRSTLQEVSEIDDGVRAAVELNGSIPTADDSKV